MARILTIISVLCVFIIGLSEAAYLPDYEHIQGVGWLRLHIVPATWADAQLRCHLEDATLTAPTTSAITAVMKKTMIANRLAESSVFTDIYASKPKGDFTSVNGWPLSNISLQWADGEPNNLGNEEDCLVMTGAGELADVSCSSVHPFFCLKRNTTSTSNCDQCDTEGYTLEPRTGRCYKFHRLSLNWQRAEMECASERAHLAVINSEVESQVFMEFFEQNPSRTIISADDIDLAHIGFYRNKSGEWLTVFGETLDEAGFKKWKTGEPNNMNGYEYCGSVAHIGTLNDVPCLGKKLPFICEMTPK